MFCYMYMYMCGMIMLCFKSFHLLVFLMSLEFVVLSLFGYMFMYLVLYNYELYFVLFFLTFSVCEGSLGLAILVMMIRSFSSDFFQSLNLLW